ncbi:MAG: vWA domain-containing protein [Myxococcota bacterium]
MRKFLTIFLGIVILLPSIAMAGTDPNCEYPNVLLLVDKSGSMDDSISGGRKWDIEYNAIKTILNNFSNSIRFGLALFPWTSSCQTGQVLVNVGDNTGSQILSTLSNNGPGGSTPLASSLEAMNNYSGIHDPSRRNFILLTTDGMDTCSNDPTGEPVEAVQLLYNSGIGVFVVGFGSGVDATTLNNMAVAGGYPRNGNPKYYQCDNAQELNQALNDILKIISQEICDGKDNDCNGEIDDHIQL